MTYVLNKALRLRDKNEPELYAPGDPCTHKCEKGCSKKQCKACKKVKKECKECSINAAYEFLKTGMVGGPSMVFCRYAERGVTGIRSDVHEKESKKIKIKNKKCKTILGYDANALYLYCSGQKMH